MAQLHGQNDVKAHMLLSLHPDTLPKHVFTTRQQAPSVPNCALLEGLLIDGLFLLVFLENRNSNLTSSWTGSIHLYRKLIAQSDSELIA